MIKSTFSRTAAKPSPSNSSKKPSLASLAQKLQGVSLSSTSATDCSLPDEGLSNTLVQNSFNDDVNSIPSASGNYVRTSELVCRNDDPCSTVTGKINPENLLVIDPASHHIASCGSVAACFSKQDGKEGSVEYSVVKNKSDITSLDLTGSLNDCSLEFDRLYINPALQKRCHIAKPTPFGRTLSAVANPLNRSNRRRQKAALYARFSYVCQTSVVSGLRRQSYSSKTPIITPFDFATPSPDDIVREKQKLAFGKCTSAKRL